MQRRGLLVRKSRSELGKNQRYSQFSNPVDAAQGIAREGYRPEQIAQEYPGLALEVIHAVIAYYLHNKSDVDAMLARISEGSERAYQE